MNDSNAQREQKSDTGRPEKLLRQLAAANDPKLWQWLDRENAELASRSEVRHRFMLLGAGVAGVVVPFVATRSDAYGPDALRWASVFLLLGVVVGVIAEAADALFARRIRRLFLAFAIEIKSEGLVPAEYEQWAGTTRCAALTRTALMCASYGLYVTGLGLLASVLGVGKP